MAFSQSSITGLSVVTDAAQILVEWTTTAPAGTWFQVYVGGKLAAKTTRTRAWLPAPGNLGKPAVQVGTVLPGERNQDFSSSLAALVGSDPMARLTWPGGRYLGGSVAGFGIFRGATPGASPDYSAPVAFVPLYRNGIPLDGYGMGGYGSGGYGSSGSEYTWVSAPLPTGSWKFAILPIDAAGNWSSTGATVETIAIVNPPSSPPAFPTGEQVRISYNPTTHQPTLTWQASTP